MKKQALKKEQSITQEELLAKGYNFAQAAREVERSAYHVWAVVTGRRTSKLLTKQLLALPDRNLQLRRKISTTN